MKEKRAYQVVRPLADRLVEMLEPVCARIEIAGSLRRMRPEVGDIEIVAVPKPIYDLTGEPIERTGVDDLLASWPVRVVKNGQKYKQFVFAGKSGKEYQVDLFLQPNPATWGVNFLIRTGADEFSKRMVTSTQHGGLCPAGLSVKDGRIWQNGKVLETPEEQNIFELWGMDYIEPSKRV